MADDGAVLDGVISDDVVSVDGAVSTSAIVSDSTTGGAFGAETTGGGFSPQAATSKTIPITMDFWIMVLPKVESSVVVKIIFIMILVKDTCLKKSYVSDASISVV